MTHEPIETTIPASPPPEALAELDAAAAALARLEARGARLALDGCASAVAITLEDDAGARALTPSQLLDLLR